MITAEVQLILNIALKEAVRMRHEYILCEHLLYCIAHHDHGAAILEKANVNITNLCTELEHHLEKELYKLDNKSKDHTPETSVGLERVINQAIDYSMVHIGKNCSLDVIIIAMLQEQESYAVYLLYKNGLSRYELLRGTEIGVGKSNLNPLGLENTSSSVTTQSSSEDTILKKYTVSLTALAREKKIDPLIGRTQKLEQVLTVLSRRKKNNPLLVGSPGVGKTALIEGLALKIVEGDIHPFFKDFEIYSIDITTLLAGTKFRGDFEERIKQLFASIEKKKRIIVFIDEIHTVIGSGTAGNSHLDTANILKPVLTKGNIRFIGATTYSEYRSYVQKDHALARRFEKIDIPEPSHEETFLILTRLKSYYERYHNIEYPQTTLKKVIELSKHYLKEKHLPDSALDILDIAGAQVKLKHFSKIKPRVTIRHIENAVSYLANVPLKKMQSSERSPIRELEINLKKHIFGQDHAITAIVKAIKMSKSSLSEKDKPIASFLFTGPTGVGKTELARVVTKFMHIKLIRLDMSEYMEAHSVSKLIGAPPGYVGYNDYQNQLTEQVRKYPHALLLLDEIEKAHNDVLNTLLQIMDYGTLTDSNSQKIDFSNVIIIMTSNAGADELAMASMGFVENDNSFKMQQKVNKIFSPEFRNRLNSIVHFNFLSETLVSKLIEKFIAEINVAIRPQKIVITLSEAAKKYLHRQGFDKKMGARSLKRVIEKNIKEKLIDDILFGALTQGGTVHFTAHGNTLTHHFTSDMTQQSAPTQAKKPPSTKHQSTKTQSIKSQTTKSQAKKPQSTKSQSTKPQATKPPSTKSQSKKPQSIKAQLTKKLN
ncbi:ATP-dependent Clp protease ATP-binding subunit ClpA [Spirochaetota bacterium]|nr:ATP-dependent Clp protease ATP-binding subunit ClpA [Spirochaetota bacterium]